MKNERLPLVTVKLTFTECHYLYGLLRSRARLVSHLADDTAERLARVIQGSARHDIPASISWLVKS